MDSHNHNCILCKKDTGKKYLYIHKTKKYTHVLCLSCSGTYINKVLDEVIDNILERDDRTWDGNIKCPYMYSHNNQCNCTIYMNRCNIDSLTKKYYKIMYIIKNNNAYLCPQKNCLSIIELLRKHSGNKISCYNCDTSLCSPFREDIEYKEVSGLKDDSEYFDMEAEKKFFQTIRLEDNFKQSLENFCKNDYDIEMKKISDNEVQVTLVSKKSNTDLKKWFEDRQRFQDWEVEKIGNEYQQHINETSDLSKFLCEIEVTPENKEDIEEIKQNIELHSNLARKMEQNLKETFARNCCQGTDLLTMKFTTITFTLYKNVYKYIKKINSWVGYMSPDQLEYDEKVEERSVVVKIPRASKPSGFFSCNNMEGFENGKTYVSPFYMNKFIKKCNLDHLILNNYKCSDKEAVIRHNPNHEVFCKSSIWVVMDTAHKYLLAEVKDSDIIKGLYISYINWDESFDEWIHFSSGRLIKPLPNAVLPSPYTDTKLDVYKNLLRLRNKCRVGVKIWVFANSEKNNNVLKAEITQRYNDTIYCKFIQDNYEGKFEVDLSSGIFIRIADDGEDKFPINFLDFENQIPFNK